MRGRTKAAACGKKGFLLHCALIRHAVKHPSAEVVLIHAHQHRRVGVFAVARVVTHPVGDHAALFRRSANDVTARTHTKAVHAADRGMLNHLVIGGRKPRIAVFTVHRLVDLLLQLFYPDPHRKRFVLHHKAAGEKRFVSIARGMPDSKDHAVGQVLLIRRHAHPFPFGAKIGDLRVEFDLAAKTDDLLPQIADGRPQTVGTDMRFVDIQNIFGRAELHECFQNEAGKIFFLDAAVEFSVRKSARTALAVLGVGLFVQDAILPQSVHLGLSFLDT